MQTTIPDRTRPPIGAGRGPRGGRDAAAVVIGAGAAGLGLALALEQRGIRVIVLEREDGVGSSWRGRYDGLRLNTVRRLSGAGGQPIPRAAGRWPARTEFVAYLEALATTPGLRLRLGVEATRVERDDHGWRVSTSRGDLRAGAVVVATGYDRVPHVPDWPGRDEFEGTLIHSSEYSSPRALAGTDVLVVGAGNSGTEIATQLARGGGRTVRLAVRTPMNLFPAELLGLPATYAALLSERAPVALVDAFGRLIQRAAYGDLAEHGLGRAPRGIATELRTRGLGPVMERGFVGELKAGRIELVPALERLGSDGALLADGSRLRPDVLIAATGFRHGLERLVGDLGVLSADGRPRVVDGRPLAGAPGLYFHGFWLPLSGQLPAMRRSARRIAKQVAALVEA